MDQQLLRDFRRTVFFIKAIAIIMGTLVFVVSRYAFLFFIAAMLPTLVAMLLDKKDNRSSSATICTFNLVGVVPYLAQMWHSADVNVTAKWMLGSLETWFIVYFLALMGQLLIWFLPDLITILYVAKSKLQIEALERQREQIYEEWDIKIFKQNDQA